MCEEIAIASERGREKEREREREREPPRGQIERNQVFT